MALTRIRALQKLSGANWSPVLCKWRQNRTGCTSTASATHLPVLSGGRRLLSTTKTLGSAEAVPADSEVCYTEEEAAIPS